MNKKFNGNLPHRLSACKIQVLICCIMFLGATQASSQMSTHYLKGDVEIISAVQNSSNNVVINFKIQEGSSDWKFGGISLSYMKGDELSLCTIAFIRSPNKDNVGDVARSDVEIESNEDGSYTTVIPLKEASVIYMVSGNSLVSVFNANAINKKIE